MSAYDHNSPHDEKEEEENQSTLYEVLGVSEGATAKDIKRAYKKGILEYHPDKNTSLDAQVATRRFRRIQEAYEVLADPQQRRQYDIQRNPQRHHKYTSTSSSTTPTTTRTYTQHHHYHFRPPTTSSSTTTPKKSFSFMFNSSAHASFSFGFSSSNSSSSSTTTTKTTANTQNGDGGNPELIWSFTTRGGSHRDRSESSNEEEDDDEVSSASEK